MSSFDVTSPWRLEYVVFIPRICASSGNVCHRQITTRASNEGSRRLQNHPTITENIITERLLCCFIPYDLSVGVPISCQFTIAFNQEKALVEVFSRCLCLWNYNLREGSFEALIKTAPAHRVLLLDRPQYSEWVAIDTFEFGFPSTSNVWNRQRRLFLLVSVSMEQM